VHAGGRRSEGAEGAWGLHAGDARLCLCRTKLALRGALTNGRRNVFDAGVIAWRARTRCVHCVHGDRDQCRYSQLLNRANSYVANIGGTISDGEVVFDDIDDGSQ
jgi:hypothetical protein